MVTDFPIHIDIFTLFIFLGSVQAIFLSYFFSGDYVGNENSHSPTVENYMLFALFGILAGTLLSGLGLEFLIKRGGMFFNILFFGLGFWLKIFPAAAIAGSPAKKPSDAIAAVLVAFLATLVWTGRGVLIERVAQQSGAYLLPKSEVRPLLCEGRRYF